MPGRRPPRTAIRGAAGGQPARCFLATSQATQGPMPRWGWQRGCFGWRFQMKTLLPLVAVALFAGAPTALAQSGDTNTDAVGPMVTDSKIDTQTFVTTVPNAN